MITIYHNPRCGKSRKALQRLEEKYNDITVIEYLKTPLSSEDILTLSEKLGLAPYHLIRTGEDVFKNNFADKDLDSTDWAKAIADFPILLQRPIVDKGTFASIVRDDDSLAAL